MVRSNPSIIAGCLFAACFGSSTSHAQLIAEATGRVIIVPDEGQAQINPTDRTIVLTIPLLDGEAYLGDTTLTLEVDGRASFSADRLLTLLEPRLTPSLVEILRTRLAENGQISQADLLSVGVALRYDPQSLQLIMDIAPASRASQSVAIRSDGTRGGVNYVAPADFSAYLNIRGSVDWLQQGSAAGLTAPITFIDGAIRTQNLVLESAANWQSGAAGADFQRRWTRLIYDDQNSLARTTLGDLRVLSRGFQSAPEISGVSISRLYSLLDPQRIIRPRGNRSFQINRHSVVEVRVNNQLVRRLELDPGTFDLTDFPFAQGANDVELMITDDTGQSETFNFNIFLDQSQLAKGLSEFSLYAGVRAPLGRTGPVYSDDLAISGFYRRGISDRLTLGANAQADSDGWMSGLEAVFATPIGSFGAFTSFSHVEGAGLGWASTLTFQRTIARTDDSEADVLSASLETRSQNFAPIGTDIPRNPYHYIISGSYTAGISDRVYAGLDGQYSRGRDDEPDAGNMRVTGGWRISPRLNFTADIGYERIGRRDQFSAFLSLTFQLGRSSSLRSNYDSQSNRTRLSYQTYQGAGTGSYSLNADIERSDAGVGSTVNGFYSSNRGELGLSYFGTFERDLSRLISQRASLRFGTALAFADGAFSVGRPIQDSFAIVSTHSGLGKTDVLVDADGEFSSANSGILGTALQPSLSSYSERNLLVTAPDAPFGTDLGEGSFRLLPPYRSGYRLLIGSDYMSSVVGQLLNARGEPISLISGNAVEEAHLEREPIPLFTNSAGRFGVTGLAPGRWTIILNDTDNTSFTFLIPEDAGNTLRLGALHPIPSQEE